MTTRCLRDTDIPILRKMYDSSGLRYEFPDLRGPLMEQVVVVVDEMDEPLAAGATERILQTYVFLDMSMHPAAKLRAIKKLHEVFAPLLRAKGYRETNCFVPPEMEKNFGRRLIRTFQWVRNWPSFARHF